jgi:hypothetical protein
MKPKQIVKKQRQPVRVDVCLEFDDPRFVKMAEMLAQMRDMPTWKFYSRLIQAEIGAYICNGDLGEWGKKVYDEIDDLVCNP